MGLALPKLVRRGASGNLLHTPFAVAQAASSSVTHRYSGGGLSADFVLFTRKSHALGSLYKVRQMVLDPPANAIIRFPRGLPLRIHKQTLSYKAKF